MNTTHPIEPTAYFSDCHLCARHCGVNRALGMRGYCGQTDTITAARAALHFWEEPCISGNRGSGAVFFSGCSMRCVFCQNHDIALGLVQKEITPDKLSDIFLHLQDQGAHNINLVTGTHFIPHIAGALEQSKNHGLTIPIVYNTAGYETPQSLSLLDGLIDVYLPDLKYFDSGISMRYANCKDYFQVATAAISEMYRQVGKPEFAKEPFGCLSDNPSFGTHDCITENPSFENHNNISDKLSSISPKVPEPGSNLSDISESHLIQKGVIVRHLLLPGLLEDSKKVLDYLVATYKDDVYISLMSQYTPMKDLDTEKYPELGRTVRKREYNSLVDYALNLGLSNVFIQGESVAKESFIPSFNFEGLY